MNTSRTRSPWKKWGLAVLFWTLIGVFFATQTYINRAPNGTWVEAFERAMPRWYLWGLLTPFIITLDRRLARRLPQLPQRLLLHIPLALGWTAVYMVLSFGVESALAGAFIALDKYFFTRHTFWDLMIYGALLGVHLAHDAYREIQRREMKTVQLEKSLAEARLHALKAQLHPHFLFNTLNAVSAFIEKRPQKARLMMAHLGHLLRFALDFADRQTITLAEELDILEDYLAIERIRFKDQLTVEVQADPDALQALVPSFLLQPLVENAIRHGILSRIAVGHIDVTAHRHNGQLHLTVQDNGVGLPEGWRLPEQGGVGLTNTLERLDHLYNGTHHFHIDRAEGGGVRVDIILPLLEQEAETA